MQSKQNGFAHMTLVAAGVVLVAASGVGYYVYDQNKSPNLSQENTNKVEVLDFLPDSLANVKSVDEIRTLAADNLNGATIVGVELEQEHGQLVYKVKLSDGRILMFNAVSGEALASTEEHNEAEQDEIPNGFVAGISIDQARQIALEQRPGETIIKIELEMEEGVGVYSVRFTDSGRVDVNATNGAVTRVEAGDEEASDDSSNENHGSNDDSSDENSGSNSGSSN
ncbi:MAG TPA: PepSY domain-containing protein [Candidatus Saccharimonadales bacterium]